MKKKSGLIWFAGGAIVIIVSIIVAVIKLSQLFLPTSAETFGALSVPIILTLAGVTLIILGKVLPQRQASEAVKKAKLTADGYNTQVYSYEDAYTAIDARVVAWENTIWDKDVQCRKAVIIETLRAINRGIQDLGQMSMWFNTSLSGPLYDAAREAVGRVDTNKLKFLSGFISYCASVTEFELMGDYFRTACVNAQNEVTGALELYASMRAKLNSYSGDPNDVTQLKAEMEQITGLF